MDMEPTDATSVAEVPAVRNQIEDDRSQDHLKDRRIVVLTLNAGSSSLKFSGYEFTDGSAEEGRLMFTGSVSKISSPQCTFEARCSDQRIKNTLGFKNMEESCEIICAWINEQRFPKPHVIGHRVVFGGGYTGPTIIDNLDGSVMDTLLALSKFAPDHMPAAICVIRATFEHFRESSQVACFDTTFHASIPCQASKYAIPKGFEEIRLHSTAEYVLNVHKYGFHGLSYEYLMHVLRDSTDCSRQKIVLAHMGHGVSLAAVKDGRVVDTTMGFSPTGGVPMCSRSGDLDPAVVLLMLEELARRRETNSFDLQTIEALSKKINDLLTKKSGLLAFSDHGNDMEALINCANTVDTDSQLREAAKFAVEYFVYHFVKSIGGLVAALGGLDVLVFTAGIGVHSPLIRSLVCSKLEFLGVSLDEATNNSCSLKSCSPAGLLISSRDSRVEVRVMETNEEFIIASQARSRWMEKRAL